jgi:hypothetical protein
MRNELMKVFSAAALVAIASQPMAAFAQNGHYVQGGVKSQRVYNHQNSRKEAAKENGKQILLLPVRLVSGLVQAPVGAVGGMARRTSESVEWVNERTFQKVPPHHGRDYTREPGKTLAKGVVMVPVGVVGTAAALPFGVAVGGVEGAVQGFSKGFDYPEN